MWAESCQIACFEAFTTHTPANTTNYVGGFIPEGVLVEIELDAVVSDTDL